MSRRRISWASGLTTWITLGALGLAAALPARAQTPVGSQFQVNAYTDNYQYGPSVAADADGDFVVAWISLGSFGTDAAFTCFYCGYSIQAQRYASDGSTQGAQFQVNTYTTSYQLYPSVAAAPGGNFVVAWASAGSSGTDTSGDSIQGQRYSLSAAVPSLPAMSPATRFALGAALMLLGAVVARAYGSVSRRSRFSR